MKHDKYMNRVYMQTVSLMHRFFYKKFFYLHECFFMFNVKKKKFMDILIFEIYHNVVCSKNCLEKFIKIIFVRC